MHLTYLIIVAIFYLIVVDIWSTLFTSTSSLSPSTTSCCSLSSPSSSSIGTSSLTVVEAQRYMGKLMNWEYFLTRLRNVSGSRKSLASGRSCRVTVVPRGRVLPRGSAVTLNELASLSHICWLSSLFLEVTITCSATENNVSTLNI